jgi:ATP-dependent Clp protease ATP-binding subunit ClpC
MFERYTEKARRVIFFARYEASQFGATAIEAEHILLGLLREDKTIAQKYFRSPNSTVESIRREIENRSVMRDKIHASVDLPLSPNAKRVLSYAADETSGSNTGISGRTICSSASFARRSLPPRRSYSSADSALARFGMR